MHMYKPEGSAVHYSAIATVRASSLLVTAEICSQKIQSYTITVSGGRKRALDLWTETALEFGCCVRDEDKSIRVCVANLVPTF